MNDFLNILKGLSPTLATIALGPAGGAVVSAIADKFGVSADVEAVAKAIAQDPQAAQKLAEIDLEQFRVEQNNVTQRWVADDQADSWLTKNIRPLTLIYLLTAYTFFAACSMFGFETRGEYVNLLGQWGMLVMSAYFGGKTLERIMKK